MLLAAASRCAAQATHYPDDTPQHTRAREMLTSAAAACHQAAQVFVLDPTLADEPAETDRGRGVDLLTELVRQFLAFLRGTVFSDYGLDRWPRDRRWAEAEAIHARIVDVGELVLAAVPRLDHDTVTGAQAISAARLAARHAQVDQAARLLTDAITAAARLPHPDPRVAWLAEVAGQLRQTAVDLAAEHEQTTTTLAKGLGMNYGARHQEHEQVGS